MCSTFLWMKYFFQEKVGRGGEEVPEISNIYRFLSKTMEAVNKHCRGAGRLTELSTACMFHGSPYTSLNESAPRLG